MVSLFELARNIKIKQNENYLYEEEVNDNEGWTHEYRLKHGYFNDENNIKFYWKDKRIK